MKVCLTDLRRFFMGKTCGLVAIVSDFGRLKVGNYQNTHTPQRHHLTSASYGLLRLQTLLLQVYGNKG